MTCAFVPCKEASTCALAGGCIHGRALAPPDNRPSTVAYNPMMGSRLDLKVEDEPEAVAASRWRAKRLAHLAVLLEDGTLTSETRDRYAREVAMLA